MNVSNMQALLLLSFQFKYLDSYSLNLIRTLGLQIINTEGWPAYIAIKITYVHIHACLQVISACFVVNEREKRTGEIL